MEFLLNKFGSNPILKERPYPLAAVHNAGI